MRASAINDTHSVTRGFSAWVCASERCAHLNSAVLCDHYCDSWTTEESWFTCSILEHTKHLTSTNAVCVCVCARIRVCVCALQLPWAHYTVLLLHANPSLLKKKSFLFSYPFFPRLMWKFSTGFILNCLFSVFFFLLFCHHPFSRLSALFQSIKEKSIFLMVHLTLFFHSQLPVSSFLSVRLILIMTSSPRVALNLHHSETVTVRWTMCKKI